MEKEPLFRLEKIEVDSTRQRKLGDAPPRYPGSGTKHAMLVPLKVGGTYLTRDGETVKIIDKSGKLISEKYLPFYGNNGLIYTYRGNVREATPLIQTKPPTKDNLKDLVSKIPEPSVPKSHQKD